MRRALIGSFLSHAILAIALLLAIAPRSSRYPPQFVYEVKLLGAAETGNARPLANTQSARMKPPPLKNDEASGQMPLPDQERTREPKKKPELAAKEVRRTDARADSTVAEVHVGRIRAASPSKDKRFAIDAPTSARTRGEPGPGAVDEIEARGTRASQPLHLTHPGNYSETYVILRATEPKYPEHERERGIEGSVTVELLVDTQGNVARANVLELVGPMSFQNSALDAVRQFEFQPPVVNGIPSTMWIKFRIKFRINS